MCPFICLLAISLFLFSNPPPPLLQAGCDLRSLSREQLQDTASALRLTADLCERALADADAAAYEALTARAASAEVR